MGVSVEVSDDSNNNPFYWSSEQYKNYTDAAVISNILIVLALFIAIIAVAIKIIRVFVRIIKKIVGVEHR